MTPEEKSLLHKQRNPVLTFPGNLGEKFVQLNFSEYSYNFTRKSKADSKIVSSISLPLPENLLQNNTFKVGAQDLGSAGMIPGEAATAYSEYLTKQGDHQITVDDIKRFSTTLYQYAYKSLLSSLPSGLETGFELAGGYYFNPFQALAFNGVDLRSYTFNWTFAPKTRAETEVLKIILREMRKNTHPRYSIDTSRAFIYYPNVCEISLVPDIITYKPSMISQIQIDYSGGGELAFLEGGNPAIVKVSMSFSEMSIWTRDDFNTDREYY